MANLVAPSDSSEDLEEKIVEMICRVGPLQIDDLAQRLSAKTPEEWKERHRAVIKEKADLLCEKGFLRQDQFSRLAINPAAI